MALHFHAQKTKRRRVQLGFNFSKVESPEDGRDSFVFEPERKSVHISSTMIEFFASRTPVWASGGLEVEDHAHLSVKPLLLVKTPQFSSEAEGTCSKSVSRVIEWPTLVA